LELGTLDRFRANFARALEAKQLDMKAASQKAGLNLSFARDILKRGRDPGLSFIEKFVRAHNLSLDRLLELPAENTDHPIGKVFIVGEADEGAWRDLELTDLLKLESPVPPNPRYPYNSQYDLILRGESLNRSVLPGSILRCIDLTRGNITRLGNGELVVAQRQDSKGCHQTLARRYFSDGTCIRLLAESSDARFQKPIPIKHGEIVGLVDFAYTTPSRTIGFS
jgi:hypothetical protein